MRELLDTPLDEISEDRLRAALASAGDEDDRWEAKGGTLRSEHASGRSPGSRTATAGSW